jgi:IclR family acetate operon transcriptional repressor
MSTKQLETADRVARVLEYFLAHPVNVGISEMSRSLGLSKSVVYRILSSLETHGFVAADDSRRYRLGYKALQLGLVALQQRDIRRLVLPRMERLRNITQETVNLSIRVGDRRVYIESLESPQEIRQRVELGREMSLLLGASSKAILAFLREDERERLLATAHDVVTATGEPLCPDKLRDELEEIRRRGYAVSISERLADAFSIAAPVLDHRGEVIGSISISGPVMRWRSEVADEYGRLLCMEVEALSRELGYDRNLTTSCSILRG